MTENDAVFVKRNYEGLLLCCDRALRESKHECLGIDLIRRSKHLEHVYHALDDEEQQVLELPGDWLFAWLDYALSADSDIIATSTTKLATILQASDFLIDEVAMDSVSDLVASRLLDSPEIEVTAEASIRAELLSDCEIHVLQHLPDGLLLSVLRAALTVRSTSMVGKRMSDELLARPRHPHPSPQSCALASLLRRLPNHLWPLALTAANPALERDAKLTLARVSTDVACDIITAAATVPHVTSLSFTSCAPPPSRAHDGTAEDPPPPPDPIAALSGLPDLVSLHLERFSLKQSRDAGSAPQMVLPRLSHLTHLNLAGSQVGCLGHGRPWAQVAQLTSLLWLGVSQVGLCYGEHALSQIHRRRERRLRSANFEQFVESIAQLTLLQELTMSSNHIGSAGWELLAPTASRLPLRSLDLNFCDIQTPSLLQCSGCDPATSFSSLERLCLAFCFNGRSPGIVRELYTCSRLTELQLSCLGPDDEVLQSLQDAPFLLESLLMESIVRVGFQALGSCLPKWTGLTQLHLRINGGSEVELSVVPALAQLTALHHLTLKCARRCDMFAPAVALLTGLTSLQLNISCGSRSEMTEFANLVTSVHQLVALEELKLLCIPLRLTVGKLNDESVHQAVAAVATLTRLSRLEMHSMRWDPVVLAEGLRALSNLKELHILSSTGPYGIESLTEGMPWLPNVRLLNLRGNLLGLQGARILATVLPEMTALEELNVIGCGHQKDAFLCQEAVAVIASALPRSVVSVYVVTTALYNRDSIALV